MTELATTGRTSAGDGSPDKLQQAASDIVDRTTDTVGSRVDGEMTGQLQRAGDMLESVAQAVRRSGEQLRDQQPQVAGVTDAAASQIERVAGHVRESRPRDLLADVEDFARQQPALFLGGALLIGAATARLLKASPQAGSGMRAGYATSDWARRTDTYRSAGSYGTASPMTGTMDDGGF